MLLRKSLLEEELHRHRLQYEKLVVQVASDINDVMIDSIILDMDEIEKEIDLINANNHVR